MRFQSELSTYSHNSQRKKKAAQKERNYYYDSFNLLNPEGTIHLLLKGDILTSYEQQKWIFRRSLAFQDPHSRLRRRVFSPTPQTAFAYP